ncbi:MAG: hypothetical protein AMXMBFR58_34150 [Phycisphaerae bacterium]|nr:hypothetical protein [Phycisphaerales bacterium]
MTGTSTELVAQKSFETEASAAVLEVRSLFAQAVEARGVATGSVTEVASGFGIHRKLAWQVAKVAYSADPLVAARQIPTGRSLGVWLDAARAVGVAEALVEQMRAAVERFETLAGTHAADRAELEMLLESCGGSVDPEAAARWREQSFTGNSFTWGARCKVLMATMVLHPSEDRQGWFHLAQVRGLFSFRQLRPGVRWIVNQSVVAHDDAKAVGSVVRRPLDAAAAERHGGVPVLPRFCSSPMPSLARRRSDEGVVQDEFLSGPVGLAGERTLVTGEVIRNLGPAHATPQNTVAHFGSAIRTPAEKLQMDMFVHRSLFAGVERELRVFSDLGSNIAFGEDDALLAPERIVHLGRGVGLAQTPDIPGYTDLARAVFEALGADASEYDLYRVCMAYPPMPSSVMIRHPFPPEPGG